MDILATLIAIGVLFFAMFIGFAPFFLCKKIILFRVYCILCPISCILSFLYPGTFNTANFWSCALNTPAVLCLFFGWGQYFLRKT